MLEKMRDFFENRIDGYDEHMLNNINLADKFYPFTANCLPLYENCHILDLGCGTGLELGEYFKLNQKAFITGIDLSSKMLEALKSKFPDKNMNLIEGSYFDVPFGDNLFDACVSVESIHHFTKKEKIYLYKKAYKALKENGYFILTDYFSLSLKEEKEHFKSLKKLKKAQKIKDKELYHFDTPLTVAHETQAFLKAGFSKVEILNSWGATYTLKAYK